LYNWKNKLTSRSLLLQLHFLKIGYTTFCIRTTRRYFYKLNPIFSQSRLQTKLYPGTNILIAKTYYSSTCLKL